MPNDKRGSADPGRRVSFRKRKEVSVVSEDKPVDISDKCETEESSSRKEPFYVAFLLDARRESAYDAQHAPQRRAMKNPRHYLIAQARNYL